MRKPIIALTILGALFVGNIYLKTHNASVPIVTQAQQADLKEYQKQKDREVELKKKLKDPTVILNEFKKIGEITSFKGNANYFKIITDKDRLFNKFTLREVTIDFKYTYGIGIRSLEYLKVTRIEGTTLYISIPKNRIQLLYIQQDPESKIIDGDKMFFVDQFSPSDTQTISTIVQQQTVNKIGVDKKAFNDAMINLQKVVEELILRLGYKTVIYNEI